MNGLPDDLGELFRHLERCYPHEGCAVIFRGPSGWRTVVMQNAYDRYHGIDPEGFPRTARTAYYFDPKQWLRESQEAEARSEQLACIVHSHADVGAYFSDEDRAMAAPGDLPLHPGASYLVVAVDAGRATGARLFRWAEGRFVEELTQFLPKGGTSL